MCFVSGGFGGLDACKACAYYLFSGYSATEAVLTCAPGLGENSAYACFAFLSRLLLEDAVQIGSVYYVGSDPRVRHCFEIVDGIPQAAAAFWFVFHAAFRQFEFFATGKTAAPVHCVSSQISVFGFFDHIYATVLPAREVGELFALPAPAVYLREAFVGHLLSGNDHLTSASVAFAAPCNCAARGFARDLYHFKIAESLTRQVAHASAHSLVAVGGGICIHAAAHKVIRAAVEDFCKAADERVFCVSEVGAAFITGYLRAGASDGFGKLRLCHVLTLAVILKCGDGIEVVEVFLYVPLLDYGGSRVAFERCDGSSELVDACHDVGCLFAVFDAVRCEYLQHLIVQEFGLILIRGDCCVQSGIGSRLLAMVGGDLLRQTEDYAELLSVGVIHDLGRKRVEFAGGFDFDLEGNCCAVKVGDVKNKLARFVGGGIKVCKCIAATGDDVQPVGIHPRAGEDVTGAVLCVGGVDDSGEVVLDGAFKVIALDFFKNTSNKLL